MLFAAMSRFNRCWWKERTFSSTEMTVVSLWKDKRPLHTWFNPEWWTPRTKISNEVSFACSRFDSSACNLIILFSRPKSDRTLFPDCQVPLEGSLYPSWIGKLKLFAFFSWNFEPTHSVSHTGFERGAARTSGEYPISLNQLGHRYSYTSRMTLYVFQQFSPLSPTVLTRAR